MSGSSYLLIIHTKLTIKSNTYCTLKNITRIQVKLLNKTHGSNLNIFLLKTIAMSFAICMTKFNNVRRQPIRESSREVGTVFRVGFHISGPRGKPGIPGFFFSEFPEK